MTEYYPHPLLDMPKEELLAGILSKILEVNPSLKLGEALPHSGVKVWEGKIVPEYLDNDPIVKLDYTVPHVERPSAVLDKSKLVKIYFEDPHCFDAFKGLTGYLHPIALDVPHAEWLKAKKPGDVVNLHDAVWYTSPYTLTKEDFSKHSYATFRFAISAQ